MGRTAGRKHLRESQAVPFAGVLERHRSLHDLDLPLVRADYEHALDTWRWVLRLAPEAGFALQAAALFHDVERLESEAGARVEQRAADYQAFKDAHARRGAEIADAHLAELGVDAATRRRIAELIAGHERPPADAAADPELALLNDADGLSFFAQNSAGFLDYYGPEHTRAKIAYTLARLSAAARARLGRIPLAPEVAALLPPAALGSPPAEAVRAPARAGAAP